MGSFGENLRREREMRGVTLDEIATSTKINPHLLRAIETDDFSKLPGGIFTRSFIRAYAGYLGLDEERVMAEFQLVAPRVDIDVRRISTANPLLPKPSGSRAGIVSAVVAVLLLAGGYALFRYSQHTLPDGSSVSITPATSNAPSGPGGSSSVAPASEGSSPPAPVPSSPANAPGGEASPGTASPPASSSNNPASAGAVSGAAASAPKAFGEGSLALQLATTERVWVAVGGDGKTLLQKTLDPNFVATFRANQYFDVTTGNAQGIILTLNGETLKPLGRYGEFRKVRLTQQGIQSPAPRGTDHSEETH